MIEAVPVEIALWRVPAQALREKRSIDVANSCVHREEELPLSRCPDTPGEAGVDIHASSRILGIERALGVVGAPGAPEVRRKVQWRPQRELEERERNRPGLVRQVGKIEDGRFIARFQDRHVRH